jgi:hypothetical protein
MRSRAFLTVIEEDGKEVPQYGVFEGQVKVIQTNDFNDE